MKEDARIAFELLVFVVVLVVAAVVVSVAMAIFWFLSVWWIAGAIALGALTCVLASGKHATTSSPENGLRKTERNIISAP